MSNLNILIISKEAIKPSSPTPCHLKTYNLSFSDHFCPPVYIPLVFFYPYFGSSSSITGHQEKAAQLLKKSLSKTLTQFFPFSGRLVASKNGSYVDCNDEGVEFMEARVNAQLSQAVHSNYQSQDDHLFFPSGTVWGRPFNSLLKVQLSHFDCGGLALAVSLSHKIGDVCTLYNFIKHWAALSHNLINPENTNQLQAVTPLFITTPKSVCPEVKFYHGKNCVTKMFIFPNSKIEQLKAEVATAKNPTKVEAINSLLYRCAVEAAKANRSSFYKIPVLTQTVNMRKRLANPLHETTVGNFSWCIQVPTVGKTHQLALKSLTSRIQKAKSKLADMTISEMNRTLKLGVVASKYVPRTFYEAFTCTSLCGYQVYRVDFGWGNPIRVTYPCPDKFFILMDTPNMDGIEALVSLEEEDMVKFQVDEQLLAYAFVV